MEAGKASQESEWVISPSFFSASLAVQSERQWKATKWIPLNFDEPLMLQWIRVLPLRSLHDDNLLTS